jgi:hypothetical protein
VFKAKSGATGPLLNVNFASLKHHLRIENIYIDNTGATGIVGLYLNNLDFATIARVKVREGTVGFDIDACDGTRFDQCLAFNQRTSGYRIKNAAAIGNTYVDCKVYQTSGALADMSVAGFDLQAGASHYFIGCEVLRTPGISFYMPYGVYLHSAATTDWLFMTSCYVDGVTDGTGANSANSASLYALDSNSIFLANCFFSANDSSGQKQRGIRLDGCSLVTLTGGRISGSGLEFRNTCDRISVNGTSFPAAFADAALNFGSSTTTNLSYNFAPPGAAIADDNAKLSAATASDAGYIGTGKRMLVSDAHIAESFILEHAATGKKKHLRVLSGATGVFEILADNGTTKILQLTDSGRLLIGNNAANQEISGGGTPEGVITAPIGSTYRRNDGGTSTTFYVKESGTGNTGWVGHGAPGGSAATFINGEKFATD